MRTALRILAAAVFFGLFTDFGVAVRAYDRRGLEFEEKPGEVGAAILAASPITSSAPAGRRSDLAASR